MPHDIAIIIETCPEFGSPLLAVLSRWRGSDLIGRFARTPPVI
jgi:hypothetical protein